MSRPMPSSPSSSNPPVPGFVGRFVLGPGLTGTLYVLLLGSAAAVLWVRRMPASAPLWLQLAAPWLFLAFLLGFAVYRLSTVRANKYPAAKAFYQLGAGALFFMLLLPAPQKQALGAQDSVLLLLRDPNPHARALAAEVARHRPEGQKYLRPLVKALGDPNPDVQAQAHRSLVHLTGRDLGAPSSPGATERWLEGVP